jgi:hypothetical protein
MLTYVKLSLPMPWRHRGVVDVQLHTFLIIYLLYLTMYFFWYFQKSNKLTNISKHQPSNSQHNILLTLIESYVKFSLPMPWRHRGGVDVQLHSFLIIYPLHISMYCFWYFQKSIKLTNISKCQLSSLQHNVLLTLIMSYVKFSLPMPWRHIGGVHVELHSFLIIYPLHLSTKCFWYFHKSNKLTNISKHQPSNSQHNVLLTLMPTYAKLSLPMPWRHRGGVDV